MQNNFSSSVLRHLGFDEDLAGNRYVNRSQRHIYFSRVLHFNDNNNTRPHRQASRLLLPATIISYSLLFRAKPELFLELCSKLFHPRLGVNWPKTSNRRTFKAVLLKAIPSDEGERRRRLKTYGVLMECDCILLCLIIKNDLNDWKCSME